MKKEITIIAVTSLVVLVTTGLFLEFRDRSERAELQNAIDQLQAEIANQNQLQDQVTAEYQQELRTLQINLHAATSQIANLSAALQDARENYFSDLEASRAAIESDAQAQNPWHFWQNYLDIIWTQAH